MKKGGCCVFTSSIPDARYAVFEFFYLTCALMELLKFMFSFRQSRNKCISVSISAILSCLTQQVTTNGQAYTSSAPALLWSTFLAQLMIQILLMILILLHIHLRLHIKL